MKVIRVAPHIELMNRRLYIDVSQHENFTKKDNAIIRISMQPFFYGCGA